MINPIFVNIFSALKGAQVTFWMKILIPRTDFLLKILSPFLGSICIDTLIFTPSIILRVKIEFSLRLTSTIQLDIFLGVKAPLGLALEREKEIDQKD